MWQEYCIELRAVPDTPLEEEHARRQGRVLGPQTVLWRLFANSYEEAVEKAIEREMSFTYRKDVWLFGSRETT